MPRLTRGPLAWGAASAASLLLAVPACTSAGPAASGRVIEVVAAENFWGSIAGQVGGAHVHVTSVITDPTADPHSYEPTPRDAREVAFARMAVVNGLGYDPWMGRLLSADTGRHTVLDVGALLGVGAGGNPHRWYNPADVEAVVAAMAADFSRLDPADASYFRSQRQVFSTVDLRDYDDLVSTIKSRYGGTTVGASESIFSMLAPALGLDLITPPSFLKAISEGTDVSPADKATIDAQIRQHRIRIYVFNSQNTTPDVQAQLQECKSEGIPTVSITETLVPASTTYQAWQVRQLRGILGALQESSSR